ncbi:MAG: 50S ribosomal protein L4 [Chloroflexi bacterium]|nr:50S ribosomal protein L4 [Chloroflexota bacterium]
MPATSAGADMPAPVAADAFGPADASTELLKRMLTAHAANRRQGTANTKSRGEVVASTAKLYRQKATGRARAGSAGSPIRRGGGVAFGPKPRRTRTRVNKRERRHAVRTLLAAKAADQGLRVAASWGDSPKTRDRAAWLQAAGLAGRVLLVDLEPSEALQRSARNIPNLAVERADTLNFYDIAVADHIVTTQAALAALQKRVGA